MAPVSFYPQNDYYRHHYAGRHHQLGGDVFAGTRYQRGYGLGALISGLFKSIVPMIGRNVVPLLKSGAKAIGKHAIKAGSNVIQDALKGQSLKSSLRKRAGEELGNLVGSAVKKVSSDKANTVNRRSANKTKSKKKKKPATSRRQRDIFD